MAGIKPLDRLRPDAKYFTPAGRRALAAEVERAVRHWASVRQWGSFDENGKPGTTLEVPIEWERGNPDGYLHISVVIPRVPAGKHYDENGKIVAVDGANPDGLLVDVEELVNRALQAASVQFFEVYDPAKRGSV